LGDFAPFLFSGAQMGASVLAAEGQVQTGNAAAAAQNYNANLAERQGYEEEAAVRKAGVRQLARRRVSVAKSGLVNEGTALDAQVADAYEIEREALYARRAGLETAKLDRMSANNAKSTSRQYAIGTLLSGAGQAGGVYYGMTRPRLGGY
jgi:hypothetical protein